MMRDVHVHFLHGNPIGYNIDFFEGFIKVAQDAGLDEIYMLEHTHQFTEFERVYEPIKAYNDFQHNWIIKRMNGSIDDYISFIKRVKATRYRNRSIMCTLIEEIQLSGTDSCMQEVI